MDATTSRSTSTASGSAPAAPGLPRVPELDGLRALLAWWVVVYHAGGNTFSVAYQIRTGPLAVLANGSLAVQVFMILSGFVIFFLLDRQHERLGPFLLRRGLRLYPVYALCFLAMVGLQGVYIGNLRAMQPHLDPTAFSQQLYDAEQPLRDLALQLLVHAPMLHGAIPSDSLHFAAGAFLMPAWSISLEWQFYLIAPLLFWLVQRGRAGVAALAIATALVFATRGAWPEFGFDAFLPLQLHLFVLGIASYYAFKKVALATPKPAWLAATPALVVAGCAGLVTVQCLRLGVVRGTTPARWLPLAIWAFTFAVLLARIAGAEGVLVRATARVLRLRPLERLGVVSYSTYLAHWPVLVLCQAAFRTLLDDPQPRTLYALHLAISMPLVAAVSFALYRFVEAPGIALGRRLAQRVAPRG